MSFNKFALIFVMLSLVQIGFLPNASIADTPRLTLEQAQKECEGHGLSKAQYDNCVAVRMYDLKADFQNLWQKHQEKSLGFKVLKAIKFFFGVEEDTSAAKVVASQQGQGGAPVSSLQGHEGYSAVGITSK